MAHLSERQRFEILMIYGYGHRKRTQSEVCTVFNGIYTDTHVSQETVCQLIEKFRETGNVKDVKRTGRPKSAKSEEIALNVLLTIVETPQVSTREVADNLKISHVIPAITALFPGKMEALTTEFSSNKMELLHSLRYMLEST
ncbi:hypothetical protein NQ318_021509 [Aromia moschata]|uniref:DUF4817 domain-containing protein n=1 Tax=Aromia moschata TaxID=1265417 RepID=A0AAV8ZC16_9CUCU|nr:hypothetical protein NQ318_021509 [Aromia moschata]